MSSFNNGTYYSPMLQSFFPTKEIGEGAEKRAILDAQEKQNKLIQEQNRILSQQNNVNTQSTSSFSYSNIPEIYEIQTRKTIYDVISSIAQWLVIISVFVGMFTFIQPSMLSLMFVGVCLLSFLTIGICFTLDRAYRSKLIDEYFDKRHKEEQIKMQQEEKKEGQEEKPEISEERRAELIKEYYEFKEAQEKRQNKQ